MATVTVNDGLGIDAENPSMIESLLDVEKLYTEKVRLIAQKLMSDADMDAMDPQVKAHLTISVNDDSIDKALELSLKTQTVHNIMADAHLYILNMALQTIVKMNSEN